MRVQFHRLALAKARKAAARYRRQDGELAIRFSYAVFEAASRIEQDPWIGAPCHGEHFWLRVKKFKYLLYYRPLDASSIVVYAVAHASRRPGYWLRRIRHP